MRAGSAAQSNAVLRGAMQRVWVNAELCQQRSGCSAAQHCAEKCRATQHCAVRAVLGSRLQRGGEQRSTVQSNAGRCSAVWCDAVQRNTVRCNGRCGSMRASAAQRDAIQLGPHSTMGSSASHCCPRFSAPHRALVALPLLKPVLGWGARSPARRGPSFSPRDGAPCPWESCTLRSLLQAVSLKSYCLQAKVLLWPACCSQPIPVLQSRAGISFFTCNMAFLQLLSPQTLYNTVSPSF